MLPHDLYRQPDAADDILDEPLVLAIARRHGAHCTAVLRRDETGGEARAYVLDEHIVLKIQRPHRWRPRTSLAKEAFLLRQIASHPDIIVPRVLGYGKHADSDYIVMTQMPGVAALTVDLTGVHRQQVLRQLGRTLRRLHSLPQAPFYGSALLPGNRSREAFVARLQVNLSQAVQVIDATPDLWPFDMAPADLGSRALAALPVAIDLVALHSNPGPIHTFVQPEEHAFIGLIDFGDAYIGHPALDWRWPTHADSLTLLQGYADEAPLSEEFLAAWHAVLVLNDMVMLATRPGTRAQTLARVHELLSVLS